MNRLIKFRCWSKGKNCWCKPVIQMPVYLDNTFALWSPATEEGGEFVWMQYTGLKDRLGKEIYEGDIVELKRKQVNGDTHRFVVEWEYMKAGFYLTLVHRYPRDQKSHFRGEHINSKNKEVIGNIFENPELIK